VNSLNKVGGKKRICYPRLLSLGGIDLKVIRKRRVKARGVGAWNKETISLGKFPRNMGGGGEL